MLRAATTILTSGLLLWCTAVAAQETYSQRAADSADAQIGLTVPLTLSGSLSRTARAQAIDPDSNPWKTGFRAVAYPSLKLGEHWYFYSALQANSEPYFYYDSYYPE